MEPSEAGSAGGTPFGMGAGHGFRFERGAFDDPFLVLRGEDVPPPGLEAVEGVWGLVTLVGAPVAFISPDVVTRLPANRPVAAIFADLTSAYVASFSPQPRDFFRARLRREVRGRVFILDQAYAPRLSARIRVTELNDDPCDLGMILPIGEICDDSCQCPRRLA